MKSIGEPPTHFQQWEFFVFRFRVTGLGEKIAVTHDNLLLRECVIRNTDFVEGIVVYAGKKGETAEYCTVELPLPVKMNSTKNHIFDDRS